MISYRRLLPREAASLTAHLCRLPPGDRSLRFFAAVSDESIAGHVGGLDWLHSVVIGAFQGGQIRGAAELCKTPDGAEMAVSVEPALQHAGVGTELVRRGLLAARNQGIPNVHMRCLLVNDQMRSVVRKFEPRLETAGGEAVADISVPSRSQISLFQETADEALGWLGDAAGRLMERS